MFNERLTIDNELYAAAHDAARAATKPRFKLGDKVVCALPGLLTCPPDYLEGKVGTVIRAPKRRSPGFLFDGEYAYTVEFENYNHNPQRMAESHLLPFMTATDKAIEDYWAGKPGAPPPLPGILN